MQPDPSAVPPGPPPPGPPSTDPARVQEPRLSVAAAARRLGIAPATLRTWDRRYGIGPTDHTPGRHRRYSPDDLARLELMQHALVRGAGPAEAAAHALAAVLPGPGRHRSAGAPVSGTRAVTAMWELVAPAAPMQDGSAVAPAAGGLVVAGEASGRVRVGGQTLRLPGAGRRARGLGRAALALDAGGARSVLVESIRADGVRATWEDVARPVLVAVGERWKATGVGVEIEHLLSECVVAAFGSGAVAAPVNADARPVLLAGMPGEQHILPMVVLAATLSGRGVACRSLGSDLPAEALAAAVRRTAPVAVVLWSQMGATADAEVIRSLPRTRPRARAFVAGPGWAGVDLPARVGRLTSLDEATDMISAAASV
jgi:hypothetical protein